MMYLQEAEDQKNLMKSMLIGRMNMRMTMKIDTTPSFTFLPTTKPIIYFYYSPTRLFWHLNDIYGRA